MADETDRLRARARRRARQAAASARERGGQAAAAARERAGEAAQAAAQDIRERRRPDQFERRVDRVQQQAGQQAAREARQEALQEIGQEFREARKERLTAEFRARAEDELLAERRAAEQARIEQARREARRETIRDARSERVKRVESRVEDRTEQRLLPAEPATDGVATGSFAGGGLFDGGAAQQALGMGPPPADDSGGDAPTPNPAAALFGEVGGGDRDRDAEEPTFGPFGGGF